MGTIRSLETTPDALVYHPAASSSGDYWHAPRRRDAPRDDDDTAWGAVEAIRFPAGWTYEQGRLRVPLAGGRDHLIWIRPAYTIPGVERPIVGQMYVRSGTAVTVPNLHPQRAGETVRVPGWVPAGWSDVRRVADDDNDRANADARIARAELRIGWVL